MKRGETGRLLLSGGIALLGFTALGLWVTHLPLTPVDAAARTIGGANLPLAIVLTESGYPLTLSCLSVGSVIVAALAGKSVRLPLAIVASQLLSQGAVNGLKSVFGRRRPEWWVHHQEAGLSYPSGHATTSVVFYGAWLLVLWFAPLPRLTRLAGCTAIGMWAVGIGWSRLALGAHYATDVLGGYLFGTAWLCTAIAIADAGGLKFLMRPSSGSPPARS